MKPQHAALHESASAVQHLMFTYDLERGSLLGLFLRPLGTLLLGHCHSSCPTDPAELSVGCCRTWLRPEGVGC